MKTETRKVTVEQEVYIANDGQEFDNEDDCLSHERDLLEEKLEFYGFDLWESDFENCVYVKTTTKEDVQNLITLAEMEGVTLKGIEVDEPGIYMYESRSDGWTNITKVIDIINGGNTDAS